MIKTKNMTLLNISIWSLIAGTSLVDALRKGSIYDFIIFFIAVIIAALALRQSWR